MSRTVQTVRKVKARAAEADRPLHLSHDLPCLRCGHAPHRFLPCDQRCGCLGDRG